MTATDFLEGLPAKVKPEAIEGLATVFHFDLEGEGGGQKTLVLKDNTLEAKDGLVDDAKCVVKAKAEDFVKVVSGELNPMMAVLTGKLKISNQSEMIKYAKIFGLM
jgi:putative sterol carrier protein